MNTAEATTSREALTTAGVDYSGSMPHRRSAVADLERLGATAFGMGAAVSTVSGSAAVLAAASCLAVPGQTAIVPGWICSGVIYALIHAGLRPVMIDVGPDFDAAVDHAAAVARTHNIGMAIYAPYGGNPVGLGEWCGWARHMEIPLLIDLAQAPDPQVWQLAAGTGAAIITSFRAGKPLGAEGGGLIAGPHELIEKVRLFLAGGRDSAGRKIALGFELPMHPDAARFAYAALAAHPAGVPAWRDNARSALHELRHELLPGWDRIAGIALSRIPCLGGQGTPLHPDATYRTAAIREAVQHRLGQPDQPELPRLAALYDRIRVVKVTPRPSTKPHGGTHAAAEKDLP